MLLLVDDHPDVRRSMVRLLSAEGFEVHAVSCGEEAIAFLESRIPHCILLDQSMPGMCGLDVLRTIRSTPRFAEIKVVMISGDDHFKGLALAAGADAFIRKGSSDWAELLPAIARLDNRQLP